MKAYRVSVNTTNGLGDTTYGPGNGDIKKGDPYRKCKNGTVFVITDDPKKIYDEFPRAIVITEVGYGYKI